MKSIGATALANLKRLQLRGRDGPEQKEVVIAWDIENARPPPGIPVEEVERAISNAFQHLPRRKRHAFLAAASPRSYAAMTAVYGQDQVNHLLSHTDFMLAPGGAKSTSTDAKLLQRIDEFIERQCALGRASYSVLVLITGDDDYTPRVKRAMHAGMDVELLHPAGITSRSLMATLEGRANVWHAEWQQFLEYWINANSSNSGSAGPSGGGQASSRQPQQGGPRASESASGGGKPAAAAAAGGNKGTQPPPPPPQQRTPQQQQQAPPPAAAASSRGSDDSRSNKGTTSNKERASAVLALSSLPVVRQSCDPDRALAAVCGWLASERRDNSAFYQSLHAFASECGCKLVVDRDLVTAAAEGGGELTLTCVDDDERHPQRTVQSARDRLRNEINEVLLGDPQVLSLAAMRQQQQQQQQQQSQWQQSPRQQQQPFFQPQPQQPSQQPPHNRQPQQAQQQAPAQRAQPQAAPQVPPPAPPAHGVGSSSSSSSRVGKERVSTTLRLPDLDFVRQSDCPEAALAMVLGWLDAARTDNSAFYQSLHAIASECGCKLVVGGDLVAARGELTLTCVDDDERHPQRAVQIARDRVRLALDAELRQPGHVLGAKLGSVVVNATKKLCDWLFSPGAAATGGGPGGGRGGGGAAAPPRVEDLEALLRQRGFCAAAAPPGWVWPASEEQLRAAAKAVVLVEEGLGLAPLPLPDGRALTARPFEPPAVGRQAAARFPEFEVAAVAAMLRSRLQPNELEAQVVWHAAAICDAAASLGPGGWISGGGGHSSSSHCDQQVRGLAAALWLRHCDGAGLCPPPQQAPRPPPPAASSKPAAAAAGAAASSVAAPNASAAADAGSTDTRSSSTPATPATTAPTTAAATPLAALPYPALAALLLRHGHDAAVLTDPQLYGTAFALLWLDARAAAAAASTAAASTAPASTAAGGTAAGGTASGTAGVGVGGTAAGRDGGDGGGGGPGGVAAAPLVGRLPDGGGWVRVVLPTAFAGTAAARAAVAQVLGSGLSCGELVAALRGLGAAPPPGSEKGEIAGLLAELVIAAAAAAAASS